MLMEGEMIKSLLVYGRIFMWTGNYFHDLSCNSELSARIDHFPANGCDNLRLDETKIAWVVLMCLNIYSINKGYIHIRKDSQSWVQMGKLNTVVIGERCGCMIKMNYQVRTMIEVLLLSKHPNIFKKHRLGRETERGKLRNTMKWMVYKQQRWNNCVEK